MSLNNDIVKSEDFIDYYNDVIRGELTLCFSINPNFAKQYKENNLEVRKIILMNGIFASLNDKIDEDDISLGIDKYLIDNSLADDEIYISSYSALIYESLFETKDIIGKEVYLIKTKGNAEDGEVKETLKFKIKGIKYNGYTNEKMLSKLSSIQFINYAYLISTDSKDMVVQLLI